jgi:hypothetical protein
LVRSSGSDFLASLGHHSLSFAAATSAILVVTILYLCPVVQSIGILDWNRAQELVRKWDVEGDKPKKRERVSVEDWKTRFIAVAEADNLSDETVR